MPDSQADRRRFFWGAVAVLVVIVALAWSLDLRSEAHVAYRVSVLRSGSVLKQYSMRDLQRLPYREVVMQGQLESGPSLLTVLADAGVEEFTEVTVIGMGIRDEGVLVLKRSQVDDDVLLDEAERGTVKLCGPDISRDGRVRDVNRIEVR